LVADPVEKISPFPLAPRSRRNPFALCIPDLFTIFYALYVACH